MIEFRYLPNSPQKLKLQKECISKGGIWVHNYYDSTLPSGQSKTYHAFASKMSKYANKLVYVNSFFNQHILTPTTIEFAHRVHNISFVLIINQGKYHGSVSEKIALKKLEKLSKRNWPELYI